VLYSGLRRQLSDTDYNRRVAECEDAARLLLEAARMRATEKPRLRHVPREVYEQFASTLPDALQRRARHFFGEQQRVREGVRLWQAGDLAAFGRLISESGQSSVDNYECGNKYLRTACVVLGETPGVLGARFSGAGFRGCCIGLMAQPPAEELAQDVLSRYVARHPDMEGQAEVHFCRTADGAGFV
jgi:galactokinase